ncbi:MAG: hypothetical protein OXG13_19915 [Gemmatimonadaceae bacterium]|nr:hypothetical protein [Gemmatimonadaceae bacterium]
MTTSHRFLRTVPLVLLWVGSLEAQSGVLQSAWTSPCTLDVVLVTFQDTTARHEGGRNARGDTIWADAFNYHHHSRPHGYDRTRDGALVPGASSYRMEDFRRLFSGDYDYSVNGETARRPAPFVGDTVHVANRTQRLPEVFGSLRHYFHQVSGGDFELHVRILNQERYNAQQGGYYPVWIELPETKGYYAERFSANDEFWLDAEMAMRDSVRAWGLDPTTYNPPDASYLPARRLRHKVLYLHSGPEFHDERDGRRSRIHPRADGITWIDHSTGVVTPGFRYVAGERRGSGSNNHRADRFASIGIHAHEIGHLLGLNHTGGSWRGTNPYTNQTSDPRAPSSIPQLGTNAFGAARTVAWGIMHGAEGPPVEGSIVRQDSAWTYAHGSCPNPLSAPYRLQLGWIAPQHIPGTTFNQLIERGRFYSFASSVRDNATFILEFRSAQGFGQYTGWYRFTEAPGLLI